MKKYVLSLIVLVLFLLFALSIPTYASIDTSSREIYIATAMGSDNTDKAKPLWHLYDRDINSTWATVENMPSSAWFEIWLTESVFIDYLDVINSGNGTNDVSIYYEDSDDIWQPLADPIEMEDIKKILPGSL